MKKLLSIFFIIIAAFAAGWWVNSFYQSGLATTSPISTVIPKPLEKYTIENLAQAEVKKGNIVLEEILEENEDFNSYLFSFEFDPTLQEKGIKKVTGQLNLPTDKGSFPVVIMLRGYVDQEIYETGIGTRKAASVLAKNGFITIAPDFLGYGESDKEAKNIFETRFQTYTTVLSILKSLHSIKEWDRENIFLWGHSNGGQIALTILEITGKDYPTTLWAPVTKPFPYSILYYTDEAEDKGKFIRRELSKFENLYNADSFSLDECFEKIKAPLQIHQGTADEAVPIVWSNEFVKKLERLDINITYYKYAGANHNMVPSWNTVVSRDLSFFKKYITD
ncbi:alpha/beta fold hydrolase [Candidatus Woesebacteria bacterium]|nr:alpha/beta fold hydrolase [Candidatus Woesebacteria bacterium]